MECFLSKDVLRKPVTELQKPTTKTLEFISFYHYATSIFLNIRIPFLIFIHPIDGALFKLCSLRHRL
jgi:hypothetical protein